MAQSNTTSLEMDQMLENVPLEPKVITSRSAQDRHQFDDDTSSQIFNILPQHDPDDTECCCGKKYPNSIIDELNPENNGEVERIVIYLYVKRENNDRVTYIYIPNAEKQKLIPEFSKSEGDILHKNSLKDNVEVDITKINERSDLNSDNINENSKETSKGLLSSEKRNFLLDPVKTTYDNSKEPLSPILYKNQDNTSIDFPLLKPLSNPQMEDNLLKPLESSQNFLNPVPQKIGKLDDMLRKQLRRAKSNKIGKLIISARKEVLQILQNNNLNLDSFINNLLIRSIYAEDPQNIDDDRLHLIGLAIEMILPAKSLGFISMELIEGRSSKDSTNAYPLLSPLPTTNNYNNRRNLRESTPDTDDQDEKKLHSINKRNFQATNPLFNGNVEAFKYVDTGIMFAKPPWLEENRNSYLYNEFDQPETKELQFPEYRNINGFPIDLSPEYLNPNLKNPLVSHPQTPWSWDQGELALNFRPLQPLKPLEPVQPSFNKNSWWHAYNPTPPLAFSANNNLKGNTWHRPKETNILKPLIPNSFRNKNEKALQPFIPTLWNTDEQLLRLSPYHTLTPIQPSFNKNSWFQAPRPISAIDQKEGNDWREPIGTNYFKPYIVNNDQVYSKPLISATFDAEEQNQKANSWLVNKEEDVKDPINRFGLYKAGKNQVPYVQKLNNLPALSSNVQGEAYSVSQRRLKPKKQSQHKSSAKNLRKKNRKQQTKYRKSANDIHKHSQVPILKEIISKTSSLIDKLFSPLTWSISKSNSAGSDDEADSKFPDPGPIKDGDSDMEGDDFPKFRIIGGKPATGSGDPLKTKGKRSVSSIIDGEMEMMKRSKEFLKGLMM